MMNGFIISLVSLFFILHEFNLQSHVIASDCEKLSDPTLQLANIWPNRIYLATYPRSGNHWTRYLIEEASHIATCSVFRDLDPIHLSEPFPWGGYCAENGCIGTCRYPMWGDAVIVKTHFPVNYPTQFDNLPCTKTIRIIRHPLDSLYSFYVWMQNFNHQPIEFYIPHKTLKSYIQLWKNFQEHWDAAENVITLYYEDMYNDLEVNLKIILDATGYAYNDEDVKRAINKFPPSGGLYRHFEHYTEEDLKIVYEQLGNLMEKHGYK